MLNIFPFNTDGTTQSNITYKACRMSGELKKEVQSPLFNYDE